MGIGILAVLEARGLGVPAEVYDRVTTCSDPDELGAWIRRAVWIDSAESLFI